MGEDTWGLGVWLWHFGPPVNERRLQPSCAQGRPMLLVTRSLLEGWEELSWVTDESLPKAI